MNITEFACCRFFWQSQEKDPATGRYTRNVSKRFSATGQEKKS